MSVIYTLFAYLKAFFNLKNQFKNSNVNNFTKNQDKLNRKCYVLGNGPSLKEEINNFNLETNLSSLFVVNAFAKSEYYVSLKPTFYILIDPVYWTTDLEEVWLNERQVLNDIINKTTWELNIIVPYISYNFFKNKFNCNKNLKLFFYNHTIVEGESISNFFLYSFNLSTPVFQNVLAASIFIAINLGFKDIYLLGADHSWLADIHVDEFNNVCWEEKHFYGSTKLKPFIKSDGSVYKLSQLLNDYSKMFRGYEILKKYALFKKSNIINLTKNSFIDSFQKYSFLEI
jgi:hypothetical protein